MAYFIGQRPTAGGELPRRTLFDGQNAYPRSAYRAFLNDALAAAADRTKHVVTHDHLFAVFELLVGSMPGTKAKLSKRLGHQGMQIIPHTKGGT